MYLDDPIYLYIYIYPQYYSITYIQYIYIYVLNQMNEISIEIHEWIQWIQNPWKNRVIAP